MWQTDVSIDSNYHLSSNIARYLDNIDLHYEYERSSGRDIFSIIEDDEAKHNALITSLSRLILVDVKYHYIVDRVSERAFNGLEDLLLALMLFFDGEYERDTLADILPLQYEYSIDGILNFAMRDITSNWDYLVELFERVVGEYEDIIVLIKFLHDSVSVVGSRVFLTERNGKPYLFDVKSGKRIDNVNIFDDKKKNILYTLISTHTNELYVEGEYKFDIDIDIVGKIVSVQFV